MSIEAMKRVVEAFDDLPPDHPARYANLQINALRTAIQQSKSKHRHWSEALADDLTESGDIQTNTHPAPGVPGAPVS